MALTTVDGRLVTGDMDLSSGTLEIAQVIDTANVITSAPTGTVNVDFLSKSIKYYTTAASGNFTFNIRGNASSTLNSLLDVGSVSTVSCLVTISSGTYYSTALQIDGSSVTVKWLDGLTPTAATANSIDLYTFTIIKTASATYTVIGSRSRYY
jgi:hypothetical protein